MNELVAIGQEGEVILYQPDEKIKIEVKVDMALETVWLTQAQMAELFNRDRTVITKHIGNIFREGELDPSVVCANFALTTRHGAMEGKTQTDDVMFYNLDVVISVGYRVKSRQGTLFRIWATRVLRDYLLRGCAFNRQLRGGWERKLAEVKFVHKLGTKWKVGTLHESLAESANFFFRTSCNISTFSGTI